MLRYTLVLLALMAAIVALAHPEDDFCTPGARQYRHFVVLPSSALIGLAGFWWAAVRFIP